MSIMFGTFHRKITPEEFEQRKREMEEAREREARQKREAREYRRRIEADES